MIITCNFWMIQLIQGLNQDCRKVTLPRSWLFEGAVSQSKGHRTVEGSQPITRPHPGLSEGYSANHKVSSRTFRQTSANNKVPPRTVWKFLSQSQRLYEGCQPITKLHPGLAGDCSALARRVGEGYLECPGCPAERGKQVNKVRRKTIN